jgi:galactokinase
MMRDAPDCGAAAARRGDVARPGAGAGDRARPGAGAGDLAGRVARDYAAAYGGPPEGVWFAPGRVNLIGEHTDYNGGFVLPFALAAGVAVAAGRTGDRTGGGDGADGPAGEITVWSRQRASGPVSVPADELAPGSVSGWAAYPLGMAWALGAAGYRAAGTAIAVDSDLPIGAGLSSSAALECAVGLALADLHGLAVTRPELVALASRAENEFAGAPTGIMDQSAALLCEAGHALLLDCRSGATEEVVLDPGADGLALLVVDTRARHALNDGRYAARRRSCEEAARALGVASLRDLADRPESVSQLADPELRRRARHVVTENRRVLAAAALLRRGELAAVGPLLDASHASLRDDFEVSWPQADVAVDAAIAAGAAGARMTGGGFGGSVIALVPAALVADVAAAVAGAFARAGWRPPGVMDVTPSAAGRRLR